MWLEVIQIRMTEHELRRWNSMFEQLFDQIREKERCRKVKVFKRALLETDVCLHLYHDSENVEANGSQLGLHIAAALKAFGMVNHTVWSEGDQVRS